MGWHTLKRMKSKEKDKNYLIGKTNDTNLDNVIKSYTSNAPATTPLIGDIINDEPSKPIKNSPSSPSPLNNNNSNNTVKEENKLQTLLAKALYDNLADAPDELSFRKGDIVTVIEQDVDGLVGWWLCLLHGRQGIVPGNRLKVIPPVELDRFEKSTPIGKYDQQDDSTHNYDRLPRPVKASVPMSIKDMFDIPLPQQQQRSQDDGGEIYDVPKGNNVGEIYDVPKGHDSEELYQVPKTMQNDTNNNVEQYDRPTNNNKLVVEEVYDIPKSNSAVIEDSIDSEVYDVPKSSEELEIDNLMNEFHFYNDNDVDTIKRSPAKGNTPRGSRDSGGMILSSGEPNNMVSHKVFEEVYNVPTLNRRNMPVVTSEKFQTLPRGFRTDTPKALQKPAYAVPTNQRNSYDGADVPKYTPNSDNRQPVAQYDQPHTIVQTVSDEIYDIPKQHNSGQAIPGYSTPKAQEVYDVPPSKHFQEIYDTPPIHPKPNIDEIYDTPPVRGTNNLTLSKNQFQEEIYDSPPVRPVAFSQEVYDTPPSRTNATHQAADEIYDIPPTRTTNNDSGEIYDIPPVRTNQLTTIVSDEVYDIPSNRLFANIPQADEYHTPTNQQQLASNRVLQNEQTPLYEMYGTPQSIQQDDIYAVPPKPDQSKMLDDDYVDYQDIWTRESSQSHLDTTPGVLSSPPSSSSDENQAFNPEEKKSILDQINFEAVKEIDLRLTNALNRLHKLHLAVDTCIKKLLSFCVAGWLEVASLQHTITHIRDFSGKLKTALRLLTEFGLGTLVNTTQSVDGEMLMDALINHVEPLLESYYKIKICLLYFDGNNWMVPAVRTGGSNEKFFATLNAIMILSQRIPDLCHPFTMAVKEHAARLFAPDPVKEVIKKPDIQESSKRELASRRNEGRYNAIPKMAPNIPPKPSLPAQRRSMLMDPPDSPRVNMTVRGLGQIERLVTEFSPENTKQRKYASDPTTPSHKESEKGAWGGSCPMLTQDSRNSTPPQYAAQSSRIDEEEQRVSRTYTTSDSNILTPGLAPLNQRSVSVPQNDKLRNVFSFDEKSTLSSLDHRDIEALEFFSRQVDAQVTLLRESIGNLTDSVDLREEPTVFVSHSKFIILTAHKVANGAHDIAERLIDPAIKTKVKDDTAHLNVCLKGVVAATKAAALHFPDTGVLLDMISSALAIGDALQILHTHCKQALQV